MSEEITALGNFNATSEFTTSQSGFSQPLEKAENIVLSTKNPNTIYAFILSIGLLLLIATVAFVLLKPNEPISDVLAAQSTPQIPGKIEVEDYDSFYDRSAKNHGGAYKSDAVDIEKTADLGGGYNVGWTAAGEWLQYNVDVSKSGKYNIYLRVARGMVGNSKLDVYLDGKSISSNVNISSTGNWQKWTTITIKDVQITKKAGTSSLKLQIAGPNVLENNMNINWVEFESVDPVPVPPPQPAVPSLTINYACDPANVTLSWSTTEFVNGYHVERCMGEKCTDFSPIATLSNPSQSTYTDANITPNKHYRYRVRAYISNPAVNGYWSPYVGKTVSCTVSSDRQAIPGKIEAEDYNTGGPNIAYSDKEETNLGKEYRNEGVDIERAYDKGGGYNVGWIYPNEWIKYDVDVKESGLYDIELRTARWFFGNAQMFMEIDGQPITNIINIPGTSGWQNWQTIKIENVTLNEGERVLTLRFTNSHFNLNWMNFTKVGDITSPDAGSEDVQACHSGYNPGQLVDMGSIDVASQWDMNSVVTIIDSDDYLYLLRDFIKKANDNDLLPIVRLCFGSSDPNHCADFKDPNNTVSFIKNLENLLRDSDEYVFIAGPNEPITEGWLLPAGSNIDLAVFPHSQPNMTAYLNYFKSLGQYTRKVFDEVKTFLPENREDKVQIVSAAFNFNYHGCSKKTQFISAYEEGLGPGGFATIDGVAGNDYNTSNTKVDSCYPFLRDSFFKDLGSDFKVYFTEFGAANQNDKAGLATTYKAVNAYPEVYSMNFFAPFERDNPQFAKHKLLDSELSQVLECK